MTEKFAHWRSKSPKLGPSMALGCDGAGLAAAPDTKKGANGCAVNRHSGCDIEPVMYTCVNSNGRHALTMISYDLRVSRIPVTRAYRRHVRCALCFD